MANIFGRTVQYFISPFHFFVDQMGEKLQVFVEKNYREIRQSFQVANSTNLTVILSNGRCSSHQNETPSHFFELTSHAWNASYVFHIQYLSKIVASAPGILLLNRND